MDNKKSLIFSLYQQFTGKNIQNTDTTVRGQYDPATGTYYCGSLADMDFYLSPDTKRYIASRYYDYTNNLEKDGHVLTPQEIHDVKCKAEAILQLMQKFGIPISDYSGGAER